MVHEAPRLVAFPLLLVLTACGASADLYDFDGDGVPDSADCATEDPSIYPTAVDAWGDGIDQNCDGLDGVDADRDGHASVTSGGPDCNDDAADTHPGAEDLPDDSIDQDCDGEDSSCDADRDGYQGAICDGDDCDDRDPLLTPEDADGDGWSSCAGDCDDTTDARSPGLEVEACDGLDNDCDAVVPEDERDVDEDGYLGCAGDCNDLDSDVRPGADEACDGVDSDCDGDMVDGFGDLDLDGQPDCADPDRDGDGALDVDDCAPDNAAVFPGAAEQCDEVDSNCDADLVDGFANFDADAEPDCVDLDDDGDGTDDGEDCSPLDETAYPGAEESCDGIDSDCDGSIADEFDDFEGDGLPDCFDPDDDNDGDPDASDCAPMMALIYTGAPEACDGADGDCDGVLPGNEVDADGDGYSGCAGDCNDSDPDVYVGGPELCNALDDDCDGYIPSNEQDVDGDGVKPCEGDCNDLTASIQPGAPEICDLLDDDCDGALPPEETDDDGDGIVDCLGDCDDSDPAIYPGNGLWDTPGDGIDINCDERDANDLSARFAAWDGESALDGAGVAACGVGDLDGDGLADFAIGAPWNDASGLNSGKNYVVFGSSVTPGEHSVLDADLTFDGEAAYDASGWSAEPAGDVDGDGLDDLLLGGFKNDPGGDTDAGRTYLFFGSTLAAASGAVDLTTADATFDGENPWDYSGWAFGSAGDVDGDGLSDLVFGAYGSNWTFGDAGLTYLFFGSTVAAGGSFSLASPDAWFEGESMWDFSGFAVDSAGDVDGDGLDDLLIGARYYSGAPGTYAGKAYVFFAASILAGGPGFPLGDADVQFIAESAWDQVGRDVTSAGDVDGDGLGDILLGSAYADGVAGEDSGRAYLYFGATLQTGGTFALASADVTFEAENPFDGAGISIGDAGDVDGDGLGDILSHAIGNSDGGTFAGKTYLFLGSTIAAGGSFDMAAADAAFLGEGADDAAGRFPCAAGDIDGDGLDDLLLGAGGSGSMVEAGRTYLLPSPY